MPSRAMRGWMPSTSFFFNVTATTGIYTLSLHDALPICGGALDQCQRTDEFGRLALRSDPEVAQGARRLRPPQRLVGHFDVAERITFDAHGGLRHLFQDRKSTRLNSSHSQISYAVFCLKK